MAEPQQDPELLQHRKRIGLVADSGLHAMATVALNDQEMLSAGLTIVLNLFTAVVASHPDVYPELAGKLDLIKFAILPTKGGTKQ